MNPLLTLLQINDSVFPIGGFTHSYGLETYVYKHKVHNSQSALKYAETMLRYNFFYNDAAFFNKSWELCEQKAPQAKLVELDQWITALKSPAEIRDASRKLAIRFLKVIESLHTVKPCAAYLKAIQSEQVSGHYAIAFAMYAHSQKITFNDALSAFYYNSLNSIVTNCVKLIPIGQMEGQKILFKLQPLILELIQKQKEVEDDMIGNCCIAQDINCMLHEKLYTRIYIS